MEIDMGVVKYSHNWRQDQLLLKKSFKGESTDGVQNTTEQKKLEQEITGSVMLPIELLN